MPEKPQNTSDVSPEDLSEKLMPRARRTLVRLAAFSCLLDTPDPRERAILHRIKAVAYAPDDISFTELMRISGLNPHTDLCNADFTGINFGDVDVAGWNFCGTCLSGSDLSRVKNLTLDQFGQPDASGVIMLSPHNFRGTKWPPYFTAIVVPNC